MSGSVDIDGGDVLRVISQFLQEQGLNNSLRELQEESGVALNTIDNPDAFSANVLSGAWDAVLPVVSTLKLPQAVLQSLYEQIVRELVDAKEGEAAKSLMRSSLPLVLLKQEEPRRFSRLEQVVSRGSYAADDSGGLYPEGSKEKGRQDLVQRILEHTSSAPSSRLVVLLGQALKWQQYTGQLPPGQRFDLFRASAAARRADSEKPCLIASGASIKFGAAARPTCAFFAPDCSSLITGSVDGIIEVYEPGTFRLRMDLTYQASDEFMLHDDAVLAVAVSRDSELLVSGGRDGKLKVWKLRSGECLRKFAQAHGDAPVTCAAFSRDGSQVLSGGGDGIVRLFGLRSGKCLREFIGHTSTVTCVALLDDGSTAVSGSADGSVRVWDLKSGECTGSMKPPQEVLTADAPIVAVIPLPRTVEQLAVVQRSGTAYLMTPSGAVIRTFTHARKPAPGSRDLHAAGVKISGSRGADGMSGARPGVGAIGADFTSACLSPLGKLLYCVTEDGFLYAFDTGSGALEGFSTAPLHEMPASSGAGGVPSFRPALVAGLQHHPHINQLVTYAEDGVLQVWRA